MIEARQGDKNSFRLLYITAAFPWPESEAFLIPEIHALAGLGCTITIVPTRIIEPPLKLPEEISQYCDLQVVPLVNLRVLTAFLQSVVSRPRRTFKLSRLVFGSGLKKGIKNLAVLPKAIFLANLLQDDKPGHIHAHWAGVSSTLGMLVAQLLDRKFSITAHSWDVAEDNLIAQKSDKARFIRFISERERERGLTLGALPDKSPVLHIGVAAVTNTVKPKWPHENRVELVCIGSFLEVKGHEYLIEALRCLRQRGMNVRLTLIGDGPLRHSLEKTSRDLGDAVTFMGSLPHALVQQTLVNQTFHIGVLASIVDSDGEDEGIPVSLVEMMRTGLPVIATSTGSITELLPSELKLTVAEKQPLALCEAIASLISDQRRYETLSHRMIEIVKADYAIDTVAPKLLNLMKHT